MFCQAEVLVMFLVNRLRRKVKQSATSYQKCVIMAKNRPERQVMFTTEALCDTQLRGIVTVNKRPRSNTHWLAEEVIKKARCASSQPYNKTLAPPKASMNYYRPSLGHRLLLTVALYCGASFLLEHGDYCFLLRSAERMCSPAIKQTSVLILVHSFC